MGIPDAQLSPSRSDPQHSTGGSASRWKGRITELAILLLFIGGAAYLMWPVARHLATAVPWDLGDPMENAWTFAWPAHALLHQPLHMFHGNIFFPERVTFAYTENMLGLSLFVAPLFWITHNALLTVNVATLLTYAVGGYCTYLLVRDLTGKRGPSVVAGAAYMWAPYRILNVGHVHVVAAHLLPLVLLLLLRIRRAVADEPGRRGADLDAAGSAVPAAPQPSRWPGPLRERRWRLGLALAIVMALQVWGSLTGGFITLTAVLVWGVWELFRMRLRAFKVLIPALFGIGLGLVLSVPILIPYAVLHHLHPEFRHPLEVAVLFSAHLRDVLNPAPGGRLVKPISQVLSRHFGVGSNSELLIFPGLFLSIAAPAAGLSMLFVFARAKLRGRMAPAWTGLLALFATIAVAGGVMSMGPRLGHSTNGPPLPFALLMCLPGGALRVPARFITLTLFGMAVAIGIAVAAARPPLRRVVVALCLVALAVEAFPPSFPVVAAPPITAVDRMVAQTQGAVLARPTSQYDASGQDIVNTIPGEAVQMYLSTANFRPMVDGYAAFLPNSLLFLAKEVQDFPSVPSLTLLRNGGIPIVEVQLTLIPGTPWQGVVAGLDAWPGVRLVGADSQVRVYDISGFQS
ncbi:MAG: hypothetical protein NVSMB32_14860 [Actinomycetota bacterium]